MTEYIEVNNSIVQDFAQRTLENLEFIEEQYKLYKKDKTKTEVFEVTQLINSLLGLLIFPEESFWGKIESVPLHKFSHAEKFSISDDTYVTKCVTLDVLVHHLRNSVSHCRVEFPKSKGYITKIEFTDQNPRKKAEKWKAEIGIFNLRKFVGSFAKYIIDKSSPAT